MELPDDRFLRVRPTSALRSSNKCRNILDKVFGYFPRNLNYYFRFCGIVIRFHKLMKDSFNAFLTFVTRYFPNMTNLPKDY